MKTHYKSKNIMPSILPSFAHIKDFTSQEIKEVLKSAKKLLNTQECILLTNYAQCLWLKDLAQWSETKKGKIHLNNYYRQTIEEIDSFAVSQYKVAHLFNQIQESLPEFIHSPTIESVQLLAQCFSKARVVEMNLLEKLALSVNELDFSKFFLNQVKSEELTLWGHIFYSEPHREIFLNSIQTLCATDHFHLYKNPRHEPINNAFNPTHYSRSQRLMLYKTIPPHLFEQLKTEENLDSPTYINEALFKYMLNLIKLQEPQVVPKLEQIWSEFNIESSQEMIEKLKDICNNEMTSSFHEVRLIADLMFDKITPVSFVSHELFKENMLDVKQLRTRTEDFMIIFILSKINEKILKDKALKEKFELQSFLQHTSNVRENKSKNRL